LVTKLSLVGNAVAWGALLVFLSTISYALYMSVQRRAGAAPGALRLAGLATSGGLPAVHRPVRVLRPLARRRGRARRALVVTAQCDGCAPLLPVLLVMMAIERIGPALTAQTGMIGPMSTILMGVVILGEPLNSWIAAGTVLVITGIFVFSRSARQA
jgi:drug/metabolite transporter (DMT)-like permease